MKNYYLIGIKGISMSALAIMLKNQGVSVAGYDENQNEENKFLNKFGIVVDHVFDIKKIEKADIVVYSSAFKEGNFVFDQTKKYAKVLLTRGQLLGELSRKFDKVVAVAGSHGKTTTTAMIFEILKVAGENPTLHLGGYRIEDGQNFCLGDKKFFVTEACEYYDNFLNLKPYISVVTNIEKEHMDYFKTFKNQKKSFEKFKRNSRFVIDDIDGFKAKNVHHRKDGKLSFDLYENDKKLMHLKLNLCEEINTKNCMFAYQVASFLGVPDAKIKLGLENFVGVKTRFEKVCSPFFDDVVCDYAHHPTEIAKAISSAKKIYKEKHIIVVFQPHTYSRTKTLLNEFVETFENVGLPVFFKTYSARETEKDGLSAKDLTEIVKRKNKNAVYFDDFDSLKDFLLKFEKADTMILFVGAGDLPMILHKNNFIT